MAFRICPSCSVMSIRNYVQQGIIWNCENDGVDGKCLFGLLRGFHGTAASVRPSDTSSKFGDVQSKLRVLLRIWCGRVACENSLTEATSKKSGAPSGKVPSIREEQTRLCLCLNHAFACVTPAIFVVFGV